MIIRNGFVKGYGEYWTNLNEIKTFIIRCDSHENWRITADLINPDLEEPGEEDGYLDLEDYETYEEAVAALNKAFGYEET